MLTPLDIQNKVFKKEMRGYAAQEVEDFLNLVIESYEALYKENLEAKEKIAALTDSLAQYKAMEDTLQSALVTAQSTGEQIQHNATEKAQNIVKEADNKYHQIINNAHQEVRKITYKYEELKRSMDIYRVKMVSMLESQLDLLKKNVSSRETLADLSGVTQALQEIEAGAKDGGPVPADTVKVEPVGRAEEDKQSIDEFLANRAQQ